MSLTFAFEEDLNVVLGPEEAPAFAFALALTFAFAEVPPEVPTKLSNGFARDPSPVPLRISVGHVDSMGGGCLAHD